MSEKPKDGEKLLTKRKRGDDEVKEELVRPQKRQKLDHEKSMSDEITPSPPPSHQPSHQLQIQQLPKDQPKIEEVIKPELTPMIIEEDEEEDEDDDECYDREKSLERFKKEHVTDEEPPKDEKNYFLKDKNGWEEWMKTHSEIMKKISDIAYDKRVEKEKKLMLLQQKQQEK